MRTTMLEYSEHDALATIRSVAQSLPFTAPERRTPMLHRLAQATHEVLLANGWKATDARALVGQLRAALSTALERYSLIDPDLYPGEPREDEDECLREEVEEIHAAYEAAEAFLAANP